MQLFLKILSGMMNSVDPDQTEPPDLGLNIYKHVNCIVRQLGVLNFRIFTITITPAKSCYHLTWHTPSPYMKKRREKTYNQYPKT